MADIAEAAHVALFGIVAIVVATLRQWENNPNAGQPCVALPTLSADRFRRERSNRKRPSNLESYSFEAAGQLFQ